MKMRCHWIEDPLVNPLASAPPTNMKEMKGFHPCKLQLQNILQEKECICGFQTSIEEYNSIEDFISDGLMA